MGLFNCIMTSNYRINYTPRIGWLCSVLHNITCFLLCLYYIILYINIRILSGFHKSAIGCILWFLLIVVKRKNIWQKHLKLTLDTVCHSDRCNPNYRRARHLANISAIHHYRHKVRPTSVGTWTIYKLSAITAKYKPNIYY